MREYQLAGPRLDLDGVRIRMPNQPTIYLVDQGLRRAVPDPSTYNNLFRDWEGIVVDIDVDAVPLGPPIAHGAVLVRADGAPSVYLVDRGVKRLVASPETMNRYHFAWSRIHVVPPSLVDAIPVGQTIVG